CLRFSPDREFTKLLSAGSATLRVFDAKGVQLNDAGDFEELRRFGVPAGVPDAGSPMLRLRLRDPGGDLMSGYRPQAPSDDWVPTVMVHRAVESGQGSTATDYRDVLGRPVLGAWTWLPEWEMGLGVEQKTSDLLAPMAPVRNILNIVLVLPVA